MKMQKNKLIKTLSCAALGCLSLAVLAGAPITANNVSAADDTTLTMVGAAIRPDDGAYGIRFAAKTDAPVNGAQYYVMIVPETWLTDNNYLGDCADGDYYKHLTEEKELVTDDPETPEYDGEFITMKTTPELQTSGDYNGKYLVKGTIASVDFTNSNTKFFGVAYYEKDGARVYAENQTDSVRSICYVAGAALNDESKGYDDTTKAKLKATVDDAYDFVTNGEETGAEFDFTSVTAKGYNSSYTRVSLANGSNMQIELNNVPAIDLPIEWSIDKPAVAELVNENGLIKGKSDSNYFWVTAQIAGTDVQQQIFCRPAMETKVLEDYAVDVAKYNLAAYGSNLHTNGSGAGTYNATVDEHSGVVSRKHGNSTTWAFRLGRSEEELKTLDFDVMKITLKTSHTQAILRIFGVRIESQITEANVWTTVTITKADLLAARTGDTAEAKWAEFCELYSNAGTGLSGLSYYSSHSSAFTVWLDEITWDAVAAE